LSINVTNMKKIKLGEKNEVGWNYYLNVQINPIISAASFGMHFSYLLMFYITI
jgi:hypothetical protein